jgi:hypothetical protein
LGTDLNGTDQQAGTTATSVRQPCRLIIPDCKILHANRSGNRYIVLSFG